MRKGLAVLFFLSFLIMLCIARPTFSDSTSDTYAKANSMLVAGNYNDAINYYNIVIKQTPKFYEAYIGLGMAYKELGMYQEAYDATSNAIKLKPSYYQTYYNLGIILESMGKKAEAINAYEKFLKEIPGADRFSDAKQRIIKLKKQ
jgi:tetratricopeptide (TPR) repeat protein